jgi:hypothetical protein
VVSGWKTFPEGHCPSVGWGFQAFCLSMSSCGQAFGHLCCHRLAAAIGKSRHTAEAYAAELKAKGLCSVIKSRVPYVGTTFRINEQYWPYQSGNASNTETDSPYVDSVWHSFLTLGCATGRFGPSEQRQAEDFQRRNIPLSVVEDAMLVGACRKYVSWLNSGSLPSPS